MICPRCDSDVQPLMQCPDCAFEAPAAEFELAPGDFPGEQPFPAPTRPKDPELRRVLTAALGAENLVLAFTRPDTGLVTISFGTERLPGLFLMSLKALEKNRIHTLDSVPKGTRLKHGSKHVR